MIEYVLTDKELSELDELDLIIRKLKSFKGAEFDNSIKSLVEKRNSILNKYKKAYDFWTKESFNKFWEVSIEDFDTLYIYPYKYIEDNGLLFSVYFYMNDDHKSGLTDGSIEIRYLVNNYTSYKEIDREVFENNAKLNIMNPLNKRLKKYDRYS